MTVDFEKEEFIEKASEFSLQIAWILSIQLPYLMTFYLKRVWTDWAVQTVHRQVFCTHVACQSVQWINKHKTDLETEFDEAKTFSLKVGTLK